MSNSSRGFSHCLINYRQNKFKKTVTEWMTSGSNYRIKESHKERDRKVKKKLLDNDKVRNEGALIYVYANSLVCMLHLLPLTFFCHFHLSFRISDSGEDLHFFSILLYTSKTMYSYTSLGNISERTKQKRNHKTYQALFLEVKVWLQIFITEFQVTMTISTLGPWL